MITKNIDRYRFEYHIKKAIESHLEQYGLMDDLLSDESDTSMPSIEVDLSITGAKSDSVYPVSNSVTEYNVYDATLTVKQHIPSFDTELNPVDIDEKKARVREAIRDGRGNEINAYLTPYKIKTIQPTGTSMTVGQFADAITVSHNFYVLFVILDSAW